MSLYIKGDMPIGRFHVETREPDAPSVDLYATLTGIDLIGIEVRLEKDMIILLPKLLMLVGGKLIGDHRIGGE
jgi:hypothetical protein